MKELFEKFHKELPAVRSDEIEKLGSYFEILKQWNEQMALVSKKSIDLSFGNHFADSLFISEFGKKYLEGNQAYDLGSGAGFPGLVFAIRYPEVNIRLYEKLLKKQTFLSAVAGHLELKNVQVEGAMPEELHKGLVFARAVMPPPELFSFLSKRMAENSVLIVNIGSQGDPPTAPPQFKKLDEIRYKLPLECGERRALAFKFVSRGTQKNRA